MYENCSILFLMIHNLENEISAHCLPDFTSSNPNALQYKSPGDANPRAGIIQNEKSCPPPYNIQDCPRSAHHNLGSNVNASRFNRWTF